MRILVWLPLLAAAAPKGDEPELPAVRKVTLQLENIPAIEAVSRLSRASGCPMEFYRGRHGWAVDRDDEAKAMTMDLKETPLFDAVEKFCLAHGNLSYSIGERMRILFEGRPMKASGNPQQGRFLFWSEGVEEEIRSDFTKTVRTCTVRMELAWQPDLRVLAAGAVAVSSVVDDQGRELIGGAPAISGEGEFKDWDTRGPIKLRVVTPLAPRGARSVSIKGTVALQVPRRTAFVELPLHGELKPVRAGWVTFKAGVQGVGDVRTWRFIGRPDEGRLKPEQFLDLRNGCESAYEYWIGWGKGGSIRALEDGSVEILVTERDESELSIRFTLVEGRCTLRVPFVLKDLVLPR